MLFYLFSFFPVIGIGVILWFERISRRGSGSRTFFLFLSLLLVTLTGIFQAFTQSFREYFPPTSNFQIIALSGFFLFLAQLTLEYAIHSRRIQESFLMPDFIKGLRPLILMIIATFIVILVTFIYMPYHAKLLGNSMESFLVPAGQRNNPLVVYSTNIGFFSTIYFLLMLVMTFQATNSIFKLQEGVIRSRSYPFFFQFLILVFFGIFLFGSKGTIDGVAPLFYFIVSILFFMIRMVEEFFFWSMYNLRSDRVRIEQRQHDLNLLIRRVISSPDEEDIKIVQETIENALSKAKGRMVVHEYNITGFLAFRVHGNVLKMDSPDLLFGYCTPLVDNKNFKSLDKAKLNDMVIRSTYDLEVLRSTPIENLKDFGMKLLKKAMMEKDAVILSELPENFRGLQRLIGVYPIMDTNNFVGAAVFFKDSFYQLYPLEKEIIGEMVENLGTIFALMNGKEIQRERNRLQGEMNTARNIQTSILPKKLAIKGYQVGASMQTATEVGGDVYDLVPHLKGNYISIGDVSGHGLPAGMMATIEMSAFHGALETARTLEVDLSVDKIYDIVNRVLCVINRDRIGSDKFMTMNYLFENEGKFIHAGTHEVALVFRQATGEIEELSNCIDKTGFLGISEFVVSTQSLGKFELGSGDILILYTDGVIEAKTITGEQYDIQHLKAIVKENYALTPDEIIVKIRDDLERWAKDGDIKKNNGHFADDVTLVVLKRD